jgi:hypothetical protein
VVESTERTLENEASIAGRKMGLRAA